MARYLSELNVRTSDGENYLQKAILDTDGIPNAPSSAAHAQEVFAENVSGVLQESRFITIDNYRGSTVLLPVRLIDLVSLTVRDPGSEDTDSKDLQV